MPSTLDRILALPLGQKVQARRILWEQIRRPSQALPDAPIWLCRGGRGSGKTRAGAEGLADLIWKHWDDGHGDWAVVAPTFADARDTCVEGESGLLRTLAGMYEPSRWNRSMGQLHLRNGATIFCDGADDGAYRIQGKNLRGAWVDEAGLWRRGVPASRSRDTQGREWWEVAWDESLAFAVRLEPARIIVTGTPKRGHPLIKRLLDDPTVISVRLRTEDNILNLSEHAVKRLIERYRGTSLEPQELEGEYLDEIDGALWTLDGIARYRWRPEWGEPDTTRRLVGVDPSGGSSDSSGETGIVVAGSVRSPCPCGTLPDQPHYVVLADFSVRGSPEGRAVAIADAYRTGANKVIGERNYGGDLVKALVRQVDANIPYEEVSATKGKAIRAEPVALVYEQGRVHHVDIFDLLEDQLISWTPDSGWSPDRLDAMVWALSKLMERASSGGMLRDRAVTRL